MSIHFFVYTFPFCKVSMYFFCKKYWKKPPKILNSTLNKHNIMHIPRAISTPIFFPSTHFKKENIYIKPQTHEASVCALS